MITTELKICEKTLKPKRVFTIEIDLEELMNRQTVDSTSELDFIIEKIKEHFKNI